MSLFQICYGPEIELIYKLIQKNPGIKFADLVKKIQYEEEGDISSLVEAVEKFLLNLDFIKVDENKSLWPLEDTFTKLGIVKRINEISLSISDSANPNFVFSSMYFQIFVTRNQLFVKDLHYQTNLLFEKIMVGQEKINAWKRMMEFFGLGYRVYGGFYALPHPEIMKDLINENENWEGPIQSFFETIINPIIPCINNGEVYLGMIYALLNLNKKNNVVFSKKQDLPFYSYGENKEWNWMEIGGSLK